MHPEYPNLEPRFSLEWRESTNTPIQPISPDWRFPMFECQLIGDDLARLNQDLKELVLDVTEKMAEHTSPSLKALDHHPEYDLTDTGLGWNPVFKKEYNFFYLNHPAVECLFYYFKRAHNAFIEAIDVVPGFPINIQCWGNALRGNNSQIREHTHERSVQIPYISGNYSVTADQDTATVFDTPGYSDRQIEVWNKPGQLVLFPSWVNHWTTPFERDDFRVTIAADFDLGHHSHLNYDKEYDERHHKLPLDRPPYEKARQDGVNVGDVAGVDPDVVDFINTPLAEIEEEGIHIDFAGHL